MVSKRHCVTMDNINPNLKKMEYAILGPLTKRAQEIEKELLKGVSKPFEKVINASLGDCHAMGQPPMTYIRQILALITLPHLMEDPDIPDDMKKRASDILDGCRGRSIGSYSNSFGIETIRKHVAEYIQTRDGGIPCNWENVFLTTGATEAIKYVLKLFISSDNSKKSGILNPVPQYPLYTSALTEFGITQINYYLNESSNWSINVEELERVILEAKTHCEPRAIVVINPGNPTGQVLSQKNIEDIIKFAYKWNLFILADEVYQQNIYAEGCQFHSFKKVMKEMGSPYADIEIACFMSGSKGYMGECGIRGGYVELMNVLPDVQDSLCKSIVTSLCPSVHGQALIDCVVNPPKKGELSYELYTKEKSEIFESLKCRAMLITERLNSFQGFVCNPVQGAMYAFPEIKLPSKAILAAAKVGQPADTFYAFHLLEKYGICIVPGTGFGQRSGSYHFRTTILPQTEVLEDMLQKIAKFHSEFVQQYT